VSFKVFKAFHDWLLRTRTWPSAADLRAAQQHLDMARKRQEQGRDRDRRPEIAGRRLQPGTALIRSENSIKIARSVLNTLIMVDVDAARG